VFRVHFYTDDLLFSALYISNFKKIVQ